MRVLFVIVGCGLLALAVALLTDAFGAARWWETYSERNSAWSGYQPTSPRSVALGLLLLGVLFAGVGLSPG